MKRRNGITVIVLVITIIIMLILAGIALNMVITDKGLIEKSNKSNFDLALSEMYERGNARIEVRQMKTGRLWSNMAVSNVVQLPPLRKSKY